MAAEQGATPEIISNQGSAISFGDYETEKKQKADGYEVAGDIYSVKTHNEVTRLEKNGSLLFESVPGSAVRGFVIGERTVSFSAQGAGDTRITLGLEAETGYHITIGDTVGSAKSNLSGKVSFSAELSKEPLAVFIEKI